MSILLVRINLRPTEKVKLMPVQLYLTRIPSEERFAFERKFLELFCLVPAHILWKLPRLF